MGDDPLHTGEASNPNRFLTRASDVALLVSCAGFVLGTTLLAWLTPLAGDDYYCLAILHGRSLPQWIAFLYSQLFGRVTGMLTSYFIFQSRPLFAVLVGLTLPVLALLIYGVSSGHAPRTRNSLLVVVLLTVALWLSIPIGYDVNWRSGWSQEAFPAILMLAAIFPYSRWLRHPRATQSAAGMKVLAALAMLALAALAANSHESVLSVLVALAAIFVFLVLRERSIGQVPSHLWWGLVGGAVGMSVLLAAPGNLVRARGAGNAYLTLGAHAHASLSFLVQTALVWLMPAYPWLVILLALAVAVSIAGPTKGADTRRAQAGWAWLFAAFVASSPFLAFPQVATEAGSRTVIFTMILMFVAATSLLTPESLGMSRTGLPRVATTLVVTLLVLVALGDVLLGVWTARMMDAELRVRGQLVAVQTARGQREIALPPLRHSGSRAIPWGELTADSSSWLNEAIATYYGAESAVTTSAVGATR